MMQPAIFYRLQPEKYYATAEYLEKLYGMASCSIDGYIIGEEEEKLYALHGTLDTIDEQTYQALFNLYNKVEERLIEEMLWIAVEFAKMESDAPFALFGKGFTANALDHKRIRMERVGKLRIEMEKCLVAVRGVVYKRKELTFASDQSMRIAPIDFKDACAYIDLHHRHHKRPVGHKFSIACLKGTQVVGVAMVGRPVSKSLDNGLTLEVNRLCTTGEPNVCSKLYAHCWQVAKGMGYLKMITYILSSESGVSLLAAGWKKELTTSGGSWDTPTRRRIDKAPTEGKIRYGMEWVP